MNKSDTERMLGILSHFDYEETKEPQDADLVMVNTCSIRQLSEDKAFSQLGVWGKWKQDRPDLKIGICGCVAQQKGRKVFSRAPYVDFVLGTHQIYSLPDIIKRINEGEKVCACEETNMPTINEEGFPINRVKSTNAWINITEGCNNFCTYCIVPYTRGRERSRLPETIIKEVKDALNAGFKEITLLGQNVDSYGKDFPTKQQEREDLANYRLANLLRDLNKIEGKFRIRFVTSYPTDITDELIETAVELDKVCEYFHIPMQSGSSPVLKAMNRRYDRETYAKIVEKVRKMVPDVTITSDFIAGFPGETEEQFEKSLAVCKKLNISAVVIIGGDDSNTNACVLAEYYAAKKYGVQVIGCPKTIDGDLKNDMIETSFGFDTACKTYAEVIGNIQRDCNSAQKYWHFIKLMGRSASHIALECALQTQPNVCIISEEVEEKNMSLDDIVTYVAGIVAKRAAEGNNFGTVLIPEGLIEFVPAMKRLIAELNDFLAKHDAEFKMIKKSEQRAYIISKLTKENSDLYASLPEGVARQLSLDRDPHGNVQVSLIETEKLLSEMVGKKLAEWKAEGKYVGKFAAQHHFFGYEGRCAAPSNYDADYCYSLGYTASCLIAAGKTGYMSSVRNTTAPADQWIAGGIPVTMMMNMEKRHGEMKPVIQKALVKLDGAPFKAFAANRDEWALTTSYVYPGPIQYFGPTEVCDQPTKTLQLEQA